MTHVPSRPPPEALPRRDFMGLALAAPAAAAAALVGLPPVVAAPAEALAAEPAPAHQGYRPSEHNDTYYASLRY